MARTPNNSGRSSKVVPAPTGPNIRSNPYYERVNHASLALADRTRTEFRGTIGGAPAGGIGIAPGGVTPARYDYFVGETLNSHPDYAAITDPANYESETGIINPGGVSMLVNGGIESGTYAAQLGDVITLQVIDSAGIERVWMIDPEVTASAGAITAVGVEPVIYDYVTGNSPSDHPDYLAISDAANYATGAAGAIIVTPVPLVNGFQQNWTHTLIEGDTVDVQVQDTSGNTRIWALDLAVGQATPPTIDGVPTIAGIAMEGEVLTATAAPTSGDAPITNTFTWVDQTDAALGTGATYTIKTADIGKTIRVSQTASNGVLPNDTAISAPTDVIVAIPVPPTITGVPTIAGTTMVGETATATLAPVTGDQPITSSAEWIDSDTTVRGTGLTYTFVEADVGKTFTVRQTSENGVLPNAVATSAPTGAVVPIPVPPTIDGLPTVAGVAMVGETLTATAAPVSGDEPITTTFEWDNDIGGVLGTGPTYVIVEGDVGRQIRVKQMSENGVLPNAVAYSVYTDTVAPMPVPPSIDGVPTISGTIMDGETATATLAPSSGDEPITDTVEWIDENTTVRGTELTYTFAPADVGKTFTVRQTSSNGVPPDATATSAPTVPVMAIPIPPTITGVPTVAGDTMVGDTVTATVAPSSGDEPITDTIEWVRSDTTVMGTGLTYTFIAEDVGSTFTARQTSSNGVPPDAAASSVPTAEVVPIPVPPTITGVPTISGEIKVGETATVTPASVTGDSPITNTFEWIDSDTTVRGTGTTYTFVVADGGKTFTVRQTASNGVLPNAVATSAPTVPVEALIDLAPYTLNGVPPTVIIDFKNRVFYSEGAERTTPPVDFDRSSGAFYTDAVGDLVWVENAVLREEDYVWNGAEWVGPAALVESRYRFNEILNSTTPPEYQEVAVTNGTVYTAQFEGTGTLTLGGALSGSVDGTGFGRENVTSITVTSGQNGNADIELEGDIFNLQMEDQAVYSSYIPSGGSRGYRDWEGFHIPQAALPSSQSPLSFWMIGDLTYADTNNQLEVGHLLWYNDVSSSMLRYQISTDGANIGLPLFLTGINGSYTSIQGAADSYTPGRNVPINWASWYTSTAMNGATNQTGVLGGMAATQIPDLDGFSFDLFNPGQGHVELLCVYADTVGNLGLTQAMQGMPGATYDEILVVWAADPPATGRVIDMEQETYTATGAAARQTLIDDHGWIFMDGGEV